MSFEEAFLLLLRASCAAGSCVTQWFSSIISGSHAILMSKKGASIIILTHTSWSFLTPLFCFVWRLSLSGGVD